MLVFSRDSYVWSNVGAHENIIETQQEQQPDACSDASEDRQMEVYPPSGVIPCHGFSMYGKKLVFHYPQNW